MLKTQPYSKNIGLNPLDLKRVLAKIRRSISAKKAGRTRNSNNAMKRAWNYLAPE